MDSSNALAINWVYGFSKDVLGGVQSLTGKDRNAMFYVSSHSGVIYDYENRTQLILQGHCNLITCCAVSKDKRWIVTGDVGDDNILVVWDSLSGTPAKTIFTPHKNGTIAIDLSDDALFVVTLGVPNEDGQEIAIWAWTTDSDSAILRKSLPTVDPQISIKFDPSKKSELVSCGSKTVYFWSWKEFSVEGYAGKASKKDLGQFSGAFTGTIFLPSTNRCVTSTSDGYVLLWGSHPGVSAKPVDEGMKTASKAIRLTECGINVITTVNQYFVAACADGAVRFYDFSLRLEAWFEDFAAGPLTSVSFSDQVCPFTDGKHGAPGLQFWVPEFLVGTSDAFIVGVDSQVFEELRPEDRRGVLLVQGMGDDVECMAPHPTRPLLAVSCRNGHLQIWDYSLKLLMNLREFTASSNTLPVGQIRPRTADGHKSRPLCLAYDPTDEYLVMGFAGGLMRFVQVDSLADITSFNIGNDTITTIKFSPSGLYLAAYDCAGYLMIFKRPALLKMGPRTSTLGLDESAAVGAGGGNGKGDIGTASSKDAYLYLGRVIPHKGSMTGLQFGSREGRDFLVSVGTDRRCIEYNLHACSAEAGIVISEAPTAIELTAKPTALLWHPHVGDDVEDRFVYATDDFKFKNINSDSKLCRKTTLAPSFGGVINGLHPIPLGSPELSGRYYAFSTSERIVGLGCLPLTGDPNESMGMVAHPRRISCMAVSKDGKYLFTGGGSDLSVNMWDIDVSVLPSPVQDGEPVEPFLELLEGGKGGEAHNDIVEYFYYCQLKMQPEESMEPHKLTGSIVLEELPNLLRAVGFYPTEEEVQNIINEVRYKTYMITGVTQNEVNLNDAIKIYVNHRPVIPLSTADIQSAFDEIKKKLKLTSSEVSWANIEKMLTTEGEMFSRADLGTFLTALVGSNTNDTEMATYDGASFAARVLGFDALGLPATEQY